MTIIDAINRVDAIKPNTYNPEEKIRWLSKLDGLIKEKIIDTHEGSENVSFTGYDENTELQTELLVPHPFDDIYIHYLEMKIDYTNGEYKKYNNSASVYNAAYQEYARHYNREHMPKRISMLF